MYSEQCLTHMEAPGYRITWSVIPVVKMGYIKLGYIIPRNQWVKNILGRIKLEIVSLGKRREYGVEGGHIFCCQLLNFFF